MNNFQKSIIKDAIDNPENLSDKDYDFIMSIADKENDYVLSTKQNKWLNEISQRIND